MKKKLIEVALPLDAINAASVREKSIRHGHPSTLHLWWARRPLAACRAVIWASLVDDPSAHPDKFPTEEAQEKERQRLFRILERLVTWEGGFDEQVLKEAKAEILKSTGGNPPPLLDPFAGGGSIPLEAQRLGLKAHASDLNPIPVLINKALIEIPPKFAGQPPINPAVKKELFQEWPGATGLADDVRYYGEWMRGEAWKRIGHYYPDVKITEEILAERPDLKKQGYKPGDELTVIAWLWARTVPSPDPAVKGKHVPLVKSFELSKKKGKEFIVEPVVDVSNLTYTFKVKPKQGKPPKPTYNSKQGGICIFSEAPMPHEYLRQMGNEGKMSTVLLAIVTEGEGGRIYFSPYDKQFEAAQVRGRYYSPSIEMPYNPRWFSPPAYGMKNYEDIFTPRQLIALTTISDLIPEIWEKVQADGGNKAYANAISTYMAFILGRASEYCSTICTWANNSQMEIIRGTFARHALPMTWDFAESNIFAKSSGSIEILVKWAIKVIEKLPAISNGISIQRDAKETDEEKNKVIISTDPPYYDNIGYADLSDFFYIWERKAIKKIYPNLFKTMITPKADELIATPYRHNGEKPVAKQFFEDGLESVFQRLETIVSLDFPLTIFYAFKQQEEVEKKRSASTGWETMLTGLINSGFSINGTWPISTERRGRSVSLGTNALASSIVLVCRPRQENAGVISRRDFLQELKQELPEAVRLLQHGNIAPVDMAQSAIGPGMAIFSRYEKVLEPDGAPMSVRSALTLINQVLDETLSEQEGDFDADTRWAIAWYQQYAFKEGPYGVAETLSTAKNTSVSGLEYAGILRSGGGKVKLLAREELKAGWDPRSDQRLAIWEAAQYLTKAVLEEGEEGAAKLYKALGPEAETARELAYRLYNICEQKGWAQEALAYNSLVIAWPAIKEQASRLRGKGQQTTLDL